MDVSIIRLERRPPRWDYCCDMLKSAGIKYFTLFGGAVRDAELGRTISDYDIRIWLPEQDFAQHITRFLLELPLGRFQIRESFGKVRYCLQVDNLLLDMSVRPYKGTPSIAAPAQVQIMKANAGISAVALDANGTAWCRKEYISDKANQTITIYPTTNHVKALVYQNRMQQKFPGWRVINPVAAPPLPSPPSPPLAPSCLRLKPSEPQSPDKEEHVP